MSHKRGLFTEPDILAKRLARTQPKYAYYFQQFDVDRSGNIDIQELRNLLQLLQSEVEGLPSMHAFNPGTVALLGMKFSACRGAIMFEEFAELMVYLENVVLIFRQIDTDASGAIDLDELARALQMSGFQLQFCPDDVVQRIGAAYDFSGNGVLTFDEFLHFRLVWDTYLREWELEVPQMMETITAPQVLNILERVKSQFEPFAPMVVDDLIRNRYTSMLCGYNSMLRHGQVFSLRTCESLVRRFGCGNFCMTFEGYCMMMEFVKEQKSRFMDVISYRNDVLGTSELSRLHMFSGLTTSEVQQLAYRFDERGDGVIHFDEFLEMMMTCEDSFAWKQALWISSILVPFAAFGLLIENWLVVLIVMLIGSFALYEVRYRKSHWGEVSRCLPPLYHKLDHRCKAALLLFVILFVWVLCTYCI